MNLQDYVLCPALSRWLPERLGDKVACVVPPHAKIPRALRALCRAWSEAEPPPWSGLVIAGALHRPVEAIADATLASLAVGGMLADLCVLPPRRFVEWFSSPLRAARIQEHAAERLTAWSARGLFDLEQWIAVDPPDVIVTLGRLRGAALKRK